MKPDVLIAGGGVAGSTLAILLGRAGLAVELFERDDFPREKACGEGLMPAGVAVLRRLGLVDGVGGMPFRGVRYHFRGGVVTGRFPAGAGPREGLAQRRVVLDRVLFEAAAGTAGVRARTKAMVEGPIVERGRVTGLMVDGAAHRAPLIVAADGVYSRIRRALGLDRALRRRRLGMRAHFRVADGFEASPWVDIYLGKGHELYVASLPRGELLVAALADAEPLHAPAEILFERWWHAQPLLAERLRGASRLTPVRGTFPLAGARSGTAPGVVLLGDAAGALDPIAGGGMTHALQGAELLARFASRGVAEADSWFPEFERGRAALLRDYATVTRGMLWLARHPGLVPPALGALGSWPTALSHLLGVAGGTRALFEFGPSRRLGGRI